MIRIVVGVECKEVFMFMRSTVPAMHSKSYVGPALKRTDVSALFGGERSNLPVWNAHQALSDSVRALQMKDE